MKNKYIILIISCFFINKKNYNFIDKIIIDSYYNINKIIEKPFKIVLNKINKLKYNEKIYNEYIELKEKENLYNLNNINIEYYKNEIKELNKLLNLNNNYDYKLINSEIINRDLYNWFDNIIINKGLKDKININDSVINDKGLIGKVINVTNNTSTIKLLTNFNNKISVIVNGEEEYYGLLYNYNEKDNTFIIECISSSSKLNKGLPILTSGLGEFNKGLLIGYIDDIINDSYDLSVILKVKPYVNFNDLNYVSIIK